MVWSEIGVAFFLGYLAFAFTGMAIVWVVAGISAGWLVSRLYLRRGKPAKPSRRVRNMGQALVGAALGPALAVQDFSAAAGYLPAIFAGVVLVLVGSVLIAQAYSWMFNVDRLTAGLATLPGGLGIMPSVAAEFGRPPGLVATVQAARLAIVIFTVPFIAPMFGEVTREPTSKLFEGPLSSWGWLFWVGLLLLTPVAVAGARIVRMPVAALLGPMFAALCLTLMLRALGVELMTLHVPFSQEAIGQVFLGLTVGEYLSQKVRHDKKKVVGGMMGVVATFFWSIGLALLLWAITPWSFMTCLLSVAPGGAPELIVVASAMDAELHIVVLTQIIRQIAVNALMPFWLWWFQRE